MGPWNYPRELVAIARAQWTSVYSELTARSQAAHLCVSQTAWDTHMKASELHARCLSGEAHVTVRYVKQHGSNAAAAASLAGVARCQSPGWPENILLWCFHVVCLKCSLSCCTGIAVNGYSTSVCCWWDTWYLDGYLQDSRKSSSMQRSYSVPLCMLAFFFSLVSGLVYTQLSPREREVEWKEEIWEVL